MAYKHMNDTQNSHPLLQTGLHVTPTKSITKKVGMGAGSNIRLLTYAIYSIANCPFLT